MKRRAFALLVLVALVASGAWTGCDKSGEDEPTPLKPAKLQHTPVVFSTSAGEVTVDAEVVISLADQQRGLMFREQLGEFEGMLFVYHTDVVRSFWMKDTLIPLDMIFIDGDRRVVGIVESAEPKTVRSRSVPFASRYVLEVNGGWSKSHGVGPGTRVSFPKLKF